MEKVIEKAKILVEALPYIREFRGKTFVIKIGGGSMDYETKKNFATDIVLLKFVGINPVVVHGGGPQIDKMLDDLNVEKKKIDGLRITDERTLEVVEMVLTGRINKEIVQLINKFGGMAVGVSGKDGKLIEAEILDERLGKVGDIKKVNPEVLKVLEDGGYIPVVSPLGGNDEETLNINADIAAGEIAGALKAEKLIYLTDVEGIVGEDGKLISTFSSKDAEHLKEKGIISGGMIPKIEGGLRALKKGCKKVHIIDGRIPHAILLEIFTKKGIGTELIL